MTDSRRLILGLSQSFYENWMSTLPREVLLDVLLPLDRCSLDSALLVDRNFLKVISRKMDDICLRNLEYARFYPSQKLSLIRAKDGRVCSPWTLRGGKLTLDVLEVFLLALRSSCIEKLDFYGEQQFCDSVIRHFWNLCILAIFGMGLD